jgi:hypothetical protein
MEEGKKINPTPKIHKTQIIKRNIDHEDDENYEEPIDEIEIFDLIRKISDPGTFYFNFRTSCILLQTNYKNTLEELKVLQVEGIKLKDNNVSIFFTPTITHCSMATLIGLCVRVKLLSKLNF